MNSLSNLIESGGSVEVFFSSLTVETTVGICKPKIGLEGFKQIENMTLQKEKRSTM